MKFFKQTNKKYLKNLEALIEQIRLKNRIGTLEKFTNFSSIIGAITGIFFSIITLNLTCKYGENKEQLLKLDTLARNQIKQDSSLIDILKAVKSQDSSLAVEIRQLSDLLGLSSSQLTILGKTYSLQELRNNIKEVSEQLQYYNDIKEVRDSLSIFLYKNNPQMESSWLIDSLEHQKEWYKKAFTLLSNLREKVNLLRANPYAINYSKKLQILTNFVKKIDNLNSQYSYYDLAYTQNYRTELHQSINRIFENWISDFHDELFSKE